VGDRKIRKREGGELLSRMSVGELEKGTDSIQRNSYCTMNIGVLKNPGASYLRSLWKKGEKIRRRREK